MLKFYDSYSKTLVEFNPTGKINMYVCGLTPYDKAHIGHLRTCLSFDSIKRLLIKSGLDVFHIQNITDVDDKIIKRCKETGADPKTLTETNHKDALEMFDKVGIIRADIYPKVTENINEIILIIQKLIKNGYAYQTKTGVYYSVCRFSKYGILSSQNLDEIKNGSRFDVEETKENAEDFALWKNTKGGIIEFDSPWGRGRPGWHIECSAMAGKYAKKLHIHGGARDLIFPHHENEIAQSEGATNEKFADLWVHTGFLTVNGEKMSKSLGNFVTIDKIVGKFSRNTIRFFMLNSHYRSPVDYNEGQLEAASESVERVLNSIGLLKEEIKVKSDNSDKEFKQKTNVIVSEIWGYLRNDFDTPNALAKLFDLVREINKHVSKQKIDHTQLNLIKKELSSILWVFGFEEENKFVGLVSKKSQLDCIIKEFGGSLKAKPEEMIESLIELRSEARSKKDYKKSDLIRNKLKEIGIILEDSGSGQRWKVE